MPSLRFSGKLARKRHVVVAYCPELEGYSQGYTAEEAKENLVAAVRLFLEEAARIGTLEQILAEAGFRLEPGKRARKTSTAFQAEIEVPLAAKA